MILVVHFPRGSWGAKCAIWIINGTGHKNAQLPSARLISFEICGFGFPKKITKTSNDDKTTFDAV